jgi:enoyl-CoA hydratase/carnithine racemase
VADEGHELAAAEATGEHEVLSWAEACERLASPYAVESWSAACGQPWIAVELSGDPGPADALRDGLARLVCPSFAVVPERGAPAARDAADAFDVVVETRDALAPLVANVEAAPLASAALAQLLRGHAGRTVEQGLVAESFVYSMLQAGPEFAGWLARQRTLRPEIPEEAPVKVAREGGRLELTLNHPMKRNAYSAAMRDHLCEALQLAAADDGIDEIVLRGEGPAFCSGGDLDEFGLLVDPATAHAIRTTRSAARLLAACASRVRAELHGACVGAGIELPAFARRVVASPDAWFQLPELSMGLVPGAGGTVSLPGRIGRQRTARLALSGERMDAETALGCGLVDEIAAPRDDGG